MSDAPFPCYMCKSAGTCERCRRLHAIGMIAYFGITYTPSLLGRWAVLDGIAELLIDRARLVRAHRKELREAERDAQADAREAYAEGRHAGRGDEGW